MRHLIFPILAAAVTVLSTTTAQADLGHQLSKMLADDGDTGHHFGSAVGISGNFAVIGAFNDNDNGPESGSAYIFDINDPAKPMQTFKLLPTGGEEGDQFGISVAISGIIAIVGAPGQDENGEDAGAAYLYNVITGEQIVKILPDEAEPGDQFGNSVAISGALLIIGAWGDDNNGEFSGSAYLYDASNPVHPNLIAKLLANDGEANDQFGNSVGISGLRAIVGAWWDGDNGDKSGSAYIFETITGQQLFKLSASDGSSEEFFGNSVAINGDTAIVGVQYDDVIGINSGSAYLFDATTGEQIYKLQPEDAAEGDFFGQTVAISGTTAVIGSYWDDDNGDKSGSAYLFDLKSGLQFIKLLSHDEDDKENVRAGDWFGVNVAISGTTAIIGASHDEVSGLISGSAYLFDAANVPDPCPWDLDHDGEVDTSDMLALFALWGLEGLADFDGNGTTGISDLLTLFANWGPCPE